MKLTKGLSCKQFEESLKELGMFNLEEKRSSKSFRIFERLP